MERPEAIAAGLKRYYTGRPCRKSHLAERYTSTGTCVSCAHPKVAPDTPGLICMQVPIYLTLAQADNLMALDFAKQEMAKDAHLYLTKGLAMAHAAQAGTIHGGATLMATSLARYSLDDYRAQGWKNNDLIKEGLARIVPAPLVATEKCAGVTLESFRKKGWTDSQLLREGYAQPMPKEAATDK